MRYSIHSFRCAIFSVFLNCVPVAQSALDVPWSNKKYGPDGPWQAVQVKVGGIDPTLKVDAQNHADLDMYPGGGYDSFTFSSLACKPYPNSKCGNGGTWDPDDKAMDWFKDYDSPWHPPLDDTTFGLHSGPRNYTQRALTIGGRTVWNASLSHVNVGNITNLNGKVSGMQLGFLTLGGGETQQYFDTAYSEGKAGFNVSGWLFNGKLYEDKVLQSYSYGLHIGSAAFDYPGSLVFGGYNKGRIIGPITSQFKGVDAIDLLDINIGVEYGSSPFSFDSKKNLLVSDTGSIGASQEVRIDPRSPYLSLPDNTCEGLAAVLPIKLDQTTKMYHWQVDDPNYKKIVTSPAYLGFVFPPGRGTTANVTIKVPFTLLNLTLESPIVDKPVQYFPCHSFSPAQGDSFRLGRAFLQAAFMGQNWKTKTTWLSQAPGPGFQGSGLGDEITDIKDADTTIGSYDSTATNYFNQSWGRHWSIIDSPNPQASNGAAASPTNASLNGASSGSGGGLSVGAKAGIGIGAAAVALIAIGVFLLLRRSKAKGVKTDEAAAPAPIPYVDDGPADYKAPVENMPAYSDAPSELRYMSSPQEIFSESRVHELPDHNSAR
jgi:hypothetical protein